MTGPVSLPALSQDIKVNTSDLDRASAAADKFAQNMKKALDIKTTDFTAHMREVRDALNQTQQQSQQLGSALDKLSNRFAVTDRVAQSAQKNVKQFGDSALKSTEGSKQLEQGLAKVAIAADAASKEMNKAQNSANTLGNTMFRAAAGAGAMATGLAGLAVSATGAAVVGQLGTSMFGLVDALGQVAPLLGTLPGLLLPVVAGGGALVAAFDGNKGATAQLTAFAKSLQPIQKLLQQGVDVPLKNTLADIKPLIPDLKSSAQDFITGFTATIKQFDGVLSSSQFKGDFNEVLHDSVTNFGLLGNAGVHAFSALENVVAAAQPVVNAFFARIDNISQHLDTLVQQARNSGELTDVFAEAAIRAQQLLGVIGNVVTGVFNIAQAAQKVGLTDDFISGLQKGTLAFKNFATTNSTELESLLYKSDATLKAFGGLVGDVVSNLVHVLSLVNVAPLVDDIDQLIKPLADQLPLVINDTVTAIGKFVPAAKDAIGPLGSLTDSAVKGFGDIAPLVDTVVKEISGPLVDAAKGAEREIAAIEPGIQSTFKKIADDTKGAFSNLGGLGAGAGAFANGALADAEAAIKALGSDARDIVHDFQPLTDAIGNFLASLAKGGSVLQAAETLLKLFGSAASEVVTLLKPLIDLVTGVVNAISKLPGPIEDVVVAFAALKIVPSIISNMKKSTDDLGNSLGDGGKKVGVFGAAFKTLTAPITGTVNALKNAKTEVQQFGDNMKIQGALGAEELGRQLSVTERAVASFNSTSQGTIGTLSRFNQTVNDIQRGAEAVEEPVSKTSAAFQALAEQSQPIGQIRDKFISASDGASRFGKTAGIAAAAGKGLQLAGSGLLDALGGPFGIVIGAATLGLGLLADKQQEAAQAAAQHDQNVQNLTQALNASNGAVDSSIRGLEAQTLQQQKLSDGTTSIADGFARFGVNLQTATNAIVQGGAPLDALRAKLEAVVKAGTTVQTNFRTGFTTTSYTDAAKAAQDLINKLNDQASAYKTAVQNNRDLANVSGTASDRTNALADDMATLADNTASASDKANSLADALDQLSGNQVSLDDAQERLNQSFSSLGDNFSDAVKKAGDWGDALVTASGGVNTLGKNGQQLQQGLKSIRDNLLDVATATAQADANNGKSADIYADVSKQVQSARDRFIEQAKALDISSGAAAKLADAYGLIPSAVATKVSSPGAVATIKDIEAVETALGKVKDGTVVKVAINNSDAVKGLQDLGVQVKHLTGNQYAVVIDGNTKTANKKLQDFVDKANHSTGTPTIDANPGPAKGKLDLLNQQANNSKPTPKLGLNTASAQTSLAGLLGLANSSVAKPKVSLDTGPAYSSLNALLAHINSSSAHVTVNATSTHGVQVPNERGNILRFANGGFAGMTPLQANYATIVPPNTWRVVGDRSWGDEAYIPINGSQRSQSLLAETARRMGYVLEQFAEGGIAQINATQAAMTQAAQPSPIPSNQRSSQAMNLSVNPVIRVYIGQQEITGLVRTVVVDEQNKSADANGASLSMGTIAGAR